LKEETFNLNNLFRALCLPEYLGQCHIKQTNKYNNHPKTNKQAADDQLQIFFSQQNQPLIDSQRLFLSREKVTVPMFCFRKVQSLHCKPSKLEITLL